MLSDDKAIEVAQFLQLLPEAPRGDAACAAMAQWLKEVCHSDREAEWLRRELLAYADEYPGPKAIREMLYRQFRANPETPRRIGPQRTARFTTVEFECQRCDNNACYPGEDEYVRCTCPAGVKVPQEVIDSFSKMLRTEHLSRSAKNLPPIPCNRDEMRTLAQRREEARKIRLEIAKPEGGVQ